MEELALDFTIDELEAIEKYERAFGFPSVYMGTDHAYFNTYASRHLRGVEAVCWFTTSEFVVFFPTTKDDPRGYSLRPNNGSSLATRFPSALRGSKKLKSGAYKLLKYKNGFAFKRYEPLPIK